MGVVQNALKYVGWRPFGRCRHMWDLNIEVDPQENCMKMRTCILEGHVLVKTVMKLQIIKIQTFLDVAAFGF
jgi:hypothetical protein